MKTAKWTIVLAAGLLAAAPAYAEMIQGMVTYLDPSNYLMAVRETAPAGEFRQRVLTVRPVPELELGQMVAIEARPVSKSVLLEAETIRVTGEAAGVSA